MLYIRSINFTLHGGTRIVLGNGEIAAMLMRPEKQISPLKSALMRMADDFLAKINSSSFAAAQRRSALRGLDAQQLADIGLIYADGDYRPHPDARTKAGAAE